MDRYKGIIYRILDAKEADRVLYVLTDQGEKLVVIAKGVKKVKSRKAHAVDLLNFVDLKVTSGKGLPIVTETKLLNSFSRFKQGYTGLMFCQFVCETLSVFAEEGQEDPGIFNNVYQLLLVAKAEKFALLGATIVLRLLYNSGDLPKLNEDLESGLEIELGEGRVSAPVVGYLSAKKDPHAEITISDRLYKVQRFIIKHDYRQVQAIDLTPTEARQLLELHVRWLQNVAEKELKTVSLFLQSLQNNA